MNAKAQRESSELDAEEEHEKYLRALADLENLRKRKQGEVETARDQAEAHVANAFLPVLDDFRRALQAMKEIKSRGSKKKVLEGLQLVFDKFGAVLAQLEIEGFESEGQRFQAELMDAIAETPTRALPPGMVAAELGRGYTRRGKLLRPAQVVIAVQPEEDGDHE